MLILKPLLLALVELGQRLLAKRPGSQRVPGKKMLCAILPTLGHKAAALKRVCDFWARLDRTPCCHPNSMDAA